MALSTAALGSFRLFTVETGRFRLDGGAMFGVVPKPLWSKYAEPDDKNRILLTARCLLIHSTATDRVYLIDTGIGHKFDDKFSAIYKLDFSEYRLDRSLAEHGFSPSDITDVVFTHLHFDHCGGAVTRNAEDNLVPVFTGARHWVHQDQWSNVMNPNVREKASFLPDNINPLSGSGLIRQIDDQHVYEPGFEIEVVHGHTDGQQLPLLSDGSRRLLFAADLLPTTLHLPLPWVMGFDTRPLNTFEEKSSVFGRCIRDDIYLYLQHDPHNELIRLDGDPDRPEVAWSGTLNEWSSD